MSGTDAVEAAQLEIVSQLESFLAESGREREADVVSILLSEGPEELATERLAGIPGAEAAPVAALVAQWFLVLVGAFLDQLRSDAAKSGAKALGGAVAAWIRKKLGTGPSPTMNVSHRLDTIKQISQLLENAGWPEDAVSEAAEDLWRRGQAVAQKVKAAATA